MTETTFDDIKNRERFQKGFACFKKIDGDGGEQVIDRLSKTSPALAQHIIEFAFGDIYDRGVLSHRDREIATIAALSAMGTAAPQLKVHIEAGLKVGLTQAEIHEIILQMAVYAGFPAAINAMTEFEKVVAEQS